MHKKIILVLFSSLLAITLSSCSAMYKDLSTPNQMSGMPQAASSTPIVKGFTAPKSVSGSPQAAAKG